MNFTHAIADKLESTLPVKVVSWGLQGSPAVVLAEATSEEEEVRVIHEAAVWLRENGFVDIRFETGHDDHEGQPVVVLRHPWDEAPKEEAGEEANDDILSAVSAGNVDDIIGILEKRKKAFENTDTLDDAKDLLNDGLSTLGDALQMLDEAVFLLNKATSLGEINEPTVHVIVEQVDALSSKAVALTKQVDQLTKTPF